MRTRISWKRGPSAPVAKRAVRPNASSTATDRPIRHTPAAATTEHPAAPALRPPRPAPPTPRTARQSARPVPVRRPDRVLCATRGPGRRLLPCLLLSTAATVRHRATERPQYRSRVTRTGGRGRRSALRGVIWRNAGERAEAEASARPGFDGGSKHSWMEAAIPLETKPGGLYLSGPVDISDLVLGER